MSTKTFHFSLLFALLFWTCKPETTVPQVVPVDEHALIYIELLNIEHSIHTNELKKAKQHSDFLDGLLKVGYNLFCPGESAQIDAARMTNYLMGQNLVSDNPSHLLDDLRILKASILHMETDDDYDPYLGFLWRFEEDMDLATQVAMDPMLDLYEWNEFEEMVACMNQSWEPVKIHYPSPELLDHDEMKYKNQTTYKIFLETAMKQFNEAVTSMDYEEFPLCESAEALRGAYIDYIYSFITQPQDSNFILAKI